ncbi:type II toxin-antitoxin system MqsR family toxin [Labrys monachus]|uniref:Motility quorum-sensing regulator/GCU-specific mRNA interferase toxin n=1 Tax=Labrys monachus TaxID=217067 RepID=A0ABU0FMT2_9HYPH|nr:type II toxin-antitoxin system MqsR family toxin [Labrys monachus]MDQ0395917.1 motility quorum-sensing regulator/GCU-specific mRNA interferase toxin [Labrys monachus]
MTKRAGRRRTPAEQVLEPPSLWWQKTLMEKRRPTYDLEAIKDAIGSSETLAITVSALRDATALGFDRPRIADTIAGIRPRMFFKSMTTFVDHRVWQDVYHVPLDGLILYVKFQADVVTEFGRMSFKEKGS